MLQLHFKCALFIFTNLFFIAECENYNLKLTKVWGPGLKPDIIVMPARYFFIQLMDFENNSITSDPGSIFDVVISGSTKNSRPCRIWTNILNRKDGSYIIRYKVYDICDNLKISIQSKEDHIAHSPYLTKNTVYPDICNCPNLEFGKLLESWQCGVVPKQINKDLEQFQSVNWDDLRNKVIEKFNQPHSISLCHYVVKNNLVYNKCYGKYVGFKMFMDNILLSLVRKGYLNDIEFFVNLGDWPLVKNELSEKYPIFSWCGSTDSHDIVMPTYDITESTLENMGRVMLDMLSVQGNVQNPWKSRIPMGFWRGRDSNKHRLDLIDISRQHPDLFNVSLTNFFFFRDKQEEYGPKTEHISFFKFFDYKYQLALDGTVASYRFPYLLAGGSLVIKQESKYYEHFYNDLQPDVHYVPIKKDLSDLVEKIKWALNNDEAAIKIALNGQKFANDNLLPQNILCYYAHLLNEFSKKITSDIVVFPEMEKVEQKKDTNCDCFRTKDEL